VTHQTKGILSVMVPVVTWGISFVSIEVLLDVLGPMTIGAIRFTMATALLYLMMKQKKVSMTIQPKDRGLFFMAGSIGIALYFFFENTGIRYISAAPSSLILAAIPAATLVAEMVFYKRKAGWMDFIIFSGSIIGVFMIVSGDSGGSGSDRLIGYLMMVGAVLTWVVYSIASKPLFGRYDYLTIIFYQFFYSLPFFWLSVPFEVNHFSAITAEHVVHMVFLAVFASVLGFYYYARAMDLIGVTETSLFINLIPIVTIVFSLLYLHKGISLHQWIGGTVVLLAVTLDGKRQKQVKDTA